MTQLYTTAEACRLLKVSRWTLKRRAEYHRIKPTRLGRAVRWSEKALEELVERASKVGR